ncbi:MAG: aminotransferase class V-fold PLP-dependent enzyme, partial [Chlamydiota bacterium]
PSFRRKFSDSDFFVFSGHKAYGPTGIGVLYGKLELLEMMPPYQGGGDMVKTVTLRACPGIIPGQALSHTTYQDPPLRFEAGTPMIAEVIGLGCALDYLSTLGLHNIYMWEKSLLEYATKKLLEISRLRILGTASQKGAIVTFVIEGVHSLDLGTLLDAKGFAIRTGHMCAQPALRTFGVETAARISFALYNTHAEIDLFIAALKDILILLS